MVSGPENQQSNNMIIWAEVIILGEIIQNYEDPERWNVLGARGQCNLHAQLMQLGRVLSTGEEALMVNLA